MGSIGSFSGDSSMGTISWENLTADNIKKGTTVRIKRGNTILHEVPGSYAICAGYIHAAQKSTFFLWGNALDNLNIKVEVHPSNKDYQIVDLVFQTPGILRLKNNFPNINSLKKEGSIGDKFDNTLISSPEGQIFNISKGDNLRVWALSGANYYLDFSFRENSNSLSY